VHCSSKKKAIFELSEKLNCSTTEAHATTMFKRTGGGEEGCGVWKLSPRCCSTAALE